MSRSSVLLLFFFFFQAEDGIRDVAVTGVQTCALPIYRRDQRGDTGRQDMAFAHVGDVSRAPLAETDHHAALLLDAAHREPGPAPIATLLAVHDRQRSEEHTSELQSRLHLVCRLLLEKKK